MRYPPAAAHEQSAPTAEGKDTTHEHIDFSHGTFHGPVTGKRVEYRHDRPDTPGRP